MTTHIIPDDPWLLLRWRVEGDWLLLDWQTRQCVDRWADELFPRHWLRAMMVPPNPFLVDSSPWTLAGARWAIPDYRWPGANRASAKVAGQNDKSQIMTAFAGIGPRLAQQMPDLVADWRRLLGNLPIGLIADDPKDVAPQQFPRY